MQPIQRLPFVVWKFPGEGGSATAWGRFQTTQSADEFCANWQKADPDNFYVVERD